MNGRDLYAIYVEANLTQNCGCDEYDQLSELDQEVWSIFAGMLATDDPRIELAAVCLKFVRENEIGHPEDIYQRDIDPQNFFGLVEDICNVVGYYEEPF